MSKLALYYDWIDSFGGAERLLVPIFDEFPEADIYTLFVDYKRAPWAKKYAERIKTSFLQSWYFLIKNKSLLAPLMPFAVESFDLSAYNKVLSITSSFGKGLITRPETEHICYCFSPTRFLWQERSLYGSAHWLFSPILSFLREWDFIASRRVDKYLTLSSFSQNLMRKMYGVNTEVLAPPFDFQYWQKIAVQSPKQEKPYFLFVGRLEPYKRINLLIRAFNDLPGKNLLIIGNGSEKENLEEEANGNITFIEKVTDEELVGYYQNAQALLMPQAEEFGYTALESVVFNCPVISFAKSGAVEFLRETKMGIFFEEQTVAAITEKIVNFHTKSYNRGKIDWKRYEGEKFIARVRREIGEIGR